MLVQILLEQMALALVTSTNLVAVTFKQSLRKKLFTLCLVLFYRFCNTFVDHTLVICRRLS